MKKMKFIDWIGIIVLVLIVVFGRWSGYAWMLSTALVLAIFSAFFIRNKKVKLMLCLVGLILLLGMIFWNGGIDCTVR